MQLVAAHLLARVPGTLEGHSNTIMIVYDTKRNRRGSIATTKWDGLHMNAHNKYIQYSYFLTMIFKVTLAPEVHQQ